LKGGGGGKKGRKGKKKEKKKSGKNKEISRCPIQFKTREPFSSPATRRKEKGKRGKKKRKESGIRFVQYKSL